jgi:hypothetical protein
LSEPVPPHEGVVRLGRTPGMKRSHALVAGLFALAWAAVLAYVLTHGSHDQSSVDVYSELPPGFTSSMQAQGVTYAGLSPVDGATVQQVLSHATTSVAAPSGGTPIVLRTAFSATGTGKAFHDRAALMVVVPDAQGAQSGSVYVAFLDPTTYQLLTSVTYAQAGSSP